MIRNSFKGLPSDFFEKFTRHTGIEVKFCDRIDDFSDLDKHTQYNIEFGKQCGCFDAGSRTVRLYDFSYTSPDSAVNLSKIVGDVLNFAIYQLGWDGLFLSSRKEFADSLLNQHIHLHDFYHASEFMDSFTKDIVSLQQAWKRDTRYAQEMAKSLCLLFDFPDSYYVERNVNFALGHAISSEIYRRTQNGDLSVIAERTRLALEPANNLKSVCFGTRPLALMRSGYPEAPVFLSSVILRSLYKESGLDDRTFALQMADAVLSPTAVFESTKLSKTNTYPYFIVLDIKNAKGNRAVLIMDSPSAAVRKTGQHDSLSLSPYSVLWAKPELLAFLFNHEKTRNLKERGPEGSRDFVLIEELKKIETEHGAVPYAASAVQPLRIYANILQNYHNSKYFTENFSIREKELYERSQIDRRLAEISREEAVAAPVQPRERLTTTQRLAIRLDTVKGLSAKQYRILSELKISTLGELRNAFPDTLSKHFTKSEISSFEMFLEENGLSFYPRTRPCSPKTFTALSEKDRVTVSQDEFFTSIQYLNPEIYDEYELPLPVRFDHSPLDGSAGFQLFTKLASKVNAWRWCPVFISDEEMAALGVHPRASASVTHVLDRGKWVSYYNIFDTDMEETLPERYVAELKYVDEDYIAADQRHMRMLSILCDSRDSFPGPKKGPEGFSMLKRSMGASLNYFSRSFSGQADFSLSGEDFVRRGKPDAEEYRLATEATMFLANNLNSIGIKTVVVDEQQARETYNNGSEDSSFQIGVPIYSDWRDAFMDPRIDENWLNEKVSAEERHREGYYLAGEIPGIKPVSNTIDSTCDLSGVKIIRGSITFSGDVTADELTKIVGNVDLDRASVKAPYLKVISHGDCYISPGSSFDVPSLEEIWGDLSIHKALSANNLISVNGNLICNGSSNTRLPNLSWIKYNLILRNSSSLFVGKALDHINGVSLVGSSHLEAPECKAFDDLNIQDKAKATLNGCTHIHELRVTENANLVAPKLASVDYIRCTNPALTLPSLTEISGSFIQESLICGNYPELRRVDGNSHFWKCICPKVEQVGENCHSLYGSDLPQDIIQKCAKNRYFSISDGTIYGYQSGDTIYLTPAGINPNTPIHEYAHIWAKVYESLRPQEWGSIKNELRSLPLWDTIAASNDYAYIGDDDNRLAGEVLAHLVGNKGEEMMLEAASMVLGELPAVQEASQIKATVDSFRNRLTSLAAKEVFNAPELEKTGEITVNVLRSFALGTAPVIVQSVQNKFLSDLERYRQGGMASHESFDLGRPSLLLQACGVPDQPIRLLQSVLKKHSLKHGLSSVTEEQIYKALQQPIMIYRWGVNTQSTTIVSELEQDGKKITFGIQLSSINGQSFVNDIRSIHGKDALRLIKDMNNPTLDFGKEDLLWVDKEKVLGWFTGMEALLSSIVTQQELDSVTKVIKDFDNTRIFRELLARVDYKTSFLRQASSEKDIRHRISDALKTMQPGGYASPQIVNSGTGIKQISDSCNELQELLQLPIPDDLHISPRIEFLIRQNTDVNYHHTIIDMKPYNYISESPESFSLAQLNGAKLRAEALLKSLDSDGVVLLDDVLKIHKEMDKEGLLDQFSDVTPGCGMFRAASVDSLSLSSIYVGSVTLQEISDKASEYQYEEVFTNYKTRLHKSLERICDTLGNAIGEAGKEIEEIKHMQGRNANYISSKEEKGGRLIFHKGYRQHRTVYPVDRLSFNGARAEDSIVAYLTGIGIEKPEAISIAMGESETVFKAKLEDVKTCMKLFYHGDFIAPFESASRKVVAEALTKNPGGQIRFNNYLPVYYCSGIAFIGSSQAFLRLDMENKGLSVPVVFDNEFLEKRGLGLKEADSGFPVLFFNAGRAIRKDVWFLEETDFPERYPAVYARIASTFAQMNEAARTDTDLREKVNDKYLEFRDESIKGPLQEMLYEVSFKSAMGICSGVDYTPSEEELMAMKETDSSAITKEYAKDKTTVTFFNHSQMVESAIEESSLEHWHAAGLTSGKFIDFPAIVNEAISSAETAEETNQIELD